MPTGSITVLQSLHQDCIVHPIVTSGNSNGKRLRSKDRMEPLSVWEALGEEYWRGLNPTTSGSEPSSDYVEALKLYREKREMWQADGRPEVGQSKTAYEAAESVFRKVLFAHLHAAKRTALCFSGGGIRSATFGLGVLQGLAAHCWSSEKPEEPPRLLAEVDYLSTVSGGGYLGAWFSAWAARHKEGTTGVIKELASSPDADWEPEPESLRRLRKYSNYLNPQLGAFSADTWTLVATILRNIFLNWLVLLPLLAAALVAPRILFQVIHNLPDFSNNYALYAAAVLLAASVAYMIVDLPSAGNARLPQSRFLLFGLAPLVLSGILFSIHWAWEGDVHAEPSPASFAKYGVAIMAVGVILGMLFALWKHRTLNAIWILKGVGFSLVTGAVGGLLAYWLTWRFTDPVSSLLYDDRAYTWLAIPALIGVFALAQSLLVAMTSTLADDEDREWWSRSMAWMFIVMTCYFALSGIALMAPVFRYKLPPIQWHALATALAGFVASGLGLSPATSATKDEKEQRKARADEKTLQIAFDLAKKAIIPVFLLLLLGLTAIFNDKASREITALLKDPPSWSPLAPVTDVNPITVELLLAVALAFPALILSRVIDANKFSLHAMYRSRLIRTFLGASNIDRKPNLLTGFDPLDNICMAELPAKPLHIVNATLNLVKGENLAWQERKAESFTSTRYHTGSCRLGYQQSRLYASSVTLGGAITISGAAANPNMGYNSSPLLSIIMMLFNARLGAWLANPGEKGRGCWTKRGPTFSVRPLIDEAFGLTDDRNAWVNLSDGGHFENLGLYEMVLRRCSPIIVVDGSADPLFHFDDLGNAVRKIRIDMGIAIEFPDGVSIAKEITPGSKHCAVGRIDYSAVDGPGADPGTLIYIKASLSGKEPLDVRNYAEQNPSFPHQPTSDQWFDESQFESYRRLGYHVIEEIFGFEKSVSSIGQFEAAARRYCGIEKHSAPIEV
jgi:hypothetical protein